MKGTNMMLQSSLGHKQHEKKYAHKNHHYGSRSSRSRRSCTKGLQTYTTSIMQPADHDRSTRKRRREYKICSRQRNTDLISNTSFHLDRHRTRKDEKCRMTSVWALRGSSGCVAKTPNVNVQKNRTRKSKGNKGKHKGHGMIDNALDDWVLHARHPPSRTNHIHVTQSLPRPPKKTAIECNYDSMYRNDEDCVVKIKYANEMESYVHFGGDDQEYLLDPPTLATQSSRIPLLANRIIAQCPSNPSPSIQGVVPCTNTQDLEVVAPPLSPLHGSLIVIAACDDFENDDVRLEAIGDPIIDVKGCEWLDVGEQLMVLDKSTKDTNPSDIEDGDGWLLVS